MLTYSSCKSLFSIANAIKLKQSNILTEEPIYMKQTTKHNEHLTDIKNYSMVTKSQNHIKNIIQFSGWRSSNHKKEIPNKILICKKGS